WDGPVAGVEIMKNKTGEFLVNPDLSVIEGGFDMLTFASGTEDRINMIELEGIESSEESALEAFKLAQEKIKELISWQKKIISEIGKEKTNLVIPEENKKLVDEIRKFLSPKFESAIYTKDKTAREVNLSKLKSDLEEFLKTKDFSLEDLSQIEIIFENLVDTEIHKNIIEKDLRPDFRKIDEVRELYSEVGLLPRTHGSAIFVRGNTQSLAITTLGAPNSEQMIETMQFTGKKRFLLHYNFPQYSVGEIGGFRGPGRREIGHGALASKALRNLIPAKEDFPYTIRVVSEILSSNGSSSMATVCAATLSLMDAGVPIKKPVAGIAMGLMSNESGKFKVITDLQGPEDHYGDMDFKVAGTRDGVTAMQLDVKIAGLNYEMIKDTLVRAKKARMHILDSIEKTLAKPRENVSANAPQIVTCAIPQDRIGEVIGPGGKMINGIIAETGVISIDIDQDGKVYITGPTKETVQSALNIVKSIVKEFVVGEIVEGSVVKILEFGAIVQLDGNNDGMIHVSELKNGFVKNVEDVLKLGDFVRAKIIKVEDGRIGLSLKAMIKDTV
ncbi:MAG: polyribonucleotide nucleotidyltransferase, partial [Candidatus Pacebacteria bacterium]|nr:polyribonucleotide nucleotidyltransferase [Candidatus Paceibacterota bacterium]